MPIEVCPTHHSHSIPSPSMFQPYVRRRTTVPGFMAPVFSAPRSAAPPLCSPLHTVLRLSSELAVCGSLSYVVHMAVAVVVALLVMVLVGVVATGFLVRLIAD